MINLVVWFKNYPKRQNYKIVSEIQIDIDEATIKKIVTTQVIFLTFSQIK